MLLIFKWIQFDYSFCPLSENYDLQKDDEKYDVIPEIWEGKNVADFVDPDILKVQKRFVS